MEQPGPTPTFAMQNIASLVQQKINDNYLSLTRHETAVSNIHANNISRHWHADSAYSFSDVLH